MGLMTLINFMIGLRSCHGPRGTQSQNADISQVLQERIRRTGPVTVAEYMKYCLSHPLGGYYMKKDVFGSDGDFITSPEISQMFGELVGVWCLNEWLERGHGRPVQLVELGPGRGTLADDMLRVWARFPDAHRNLSLHLVEISDTMADLQKAKLCPDADLQKAKLCPDADLQKAKLCPDADLQKAKLCPDADLQKAKLCPDADLQKAKLCPDADLQKAKLCPDADLQKAKLCPDAIVEKRDIVTKMAADGASACVKDIARDNTNHHSNNDSNHCANHDNNHRANHGNNHHANHDINHHANPDNNHRSNHDNNHCSNCDNNHRANHCNNHHTNHHTSCLSKHGVPVYWYRDLKHVPRGEFSCFVAQEFFDALPIHKFQMSDGHWREVCIDYDLASKSFKYVLSQTHSKWSSLCIKDHVVAGRTHLEASPEAAVVAETIAQRIAADGGAAIIADYGHTGDKSDTFRSFRSHQLHDPLTNPGSADLTADVDFSYLKDAVSHIVSTHGPINQSTFLTNMGITVRLKPRVYLSKCCNWQML